MMISWARKSSGMLREDTFLIWEDDEGERLGETCAKHTGLAVS